MESEIAGVVPALSRRVRVTPSMCGPTPALHARIGDWTWETVSELCSVDVLRAHDMEGKPTYLSFFYIRMRGSIHMHPNGLTFGDRLAVRSASFDFGSESVLTVHRIASQSAPEGPPGGIDLSEFYDNPRPDCLYVENLNRWIARTEQGSNQNLKLASPPGFRHTTLPKLPARYSPRAACTKARQNGSFRNGVVAGYDLSIPQTTSTHRVNPARDLNGVGLLYFASFFAYVDAGILDLWAQLGRDRMDFLSRRVTDVRICYFGNTDADEELEVASRLWTSEDEDGREIAEVVIRERASTRLLAVAEVALLGKGCPR